MKFQDLYEKENKEHTAVSPGVQTLPTNQYMGAYKFSKDVAGHDGKKQHSPDASGSKAYTDKPIVVGYTDIEDRMTKAVLPKTKQTVGAGSEEPSTVQKNSPLSKNSVKEAYQNDEANVFYKYDTADGRLKQRMVQNLDEPQARSAGYKETQEQALKAAGIMRSKFDPKKFVQNQNGKWVTVYPYGHQGVAEGSEKQQYLWHGSRQQIPMYQSIKDEITEAFDYPYKLKWEKSSYGDIDASATLDDGNYLNISFNQDKNQDGKLVWNVEFDRNYSQEVTGEGDAQRVFATVLSAIQIFIKKYKPLKLAFGASKDVDQGQNSQSRARLYDSLVQRYARAWGYRVLRSDTGNLVIYEFSRIQKPKAVGEDYNNRFAKEGVAEEGYGNHPSQRVDPRTGKKYVPPKSPLGQGVAEAKGLAKKVKVVKGEHAGKTGWIREIKHGAFKGAPKTYYIDLDDGGQANNLPATALRLVKAVEEGITADIRDYFADPKNDASSTFRKQAMPPKDIQLIMLNIKQRQPVSKADQHQLADWLRRNQGTRTVYADVNESDMGEGVIYQLDKENPMSGTEVLVIGGAGRYSLDGLRAKARREVAELAKDLEIEHGGAFRRSAHNVKQLQNTLNTIVAAYDELNQIRKLGGMRSKGIKDEDATVVREGVAVMEKWTQKYKNSINCSDPKGFSQQAHCAGKKK